MPSRDPSPVTRTAAIRRGLIALGFVASLVGVGIGAGLTASSSLLPVLEACCLCAVTLGLTWRDDGQDIVFTLS